MRTRAVLRVVLAGLTLALVVAGLARGTPGGRQLVLAAANALDMPWWTMDGGVGPSSGSTYRLSGTLGQPDAASGAAALSGGSYRLEGGFWPGVGSPAPPAAVIFRVFVPVVTR